jgi:biopolymer transport protein ExbB/TolQ
MNLTAIFMDNQHQGGVLMWIIFATGVLSLYIGLDKMLFLHQFTRYHHRFVKLYNEILDNQIAVKPVGFEEYDVLLSQLITCKKEQCSGQSYFREFMICTVPILEKHFTTMSAWISIAPLLGLLGTVIGMVQTFKVIMNFGVGNPALTAEGISVALLTTQAGLVVAFPIMLFHNHLVNKKDTVLSTMLKDFEQITKKLSPVYGVNHV